MLPGMPGATYSLTRAQTGINHVPGTALLETILTKLTVKCTLVVGVAAMVALIDMEPTTNTKEMT
jgi:hypothetical protein